MTFNTINEIDADIPCQRVKNISAFIRRHINIGIRVLQWVRRKKLECDPAHYCCLSDNLRAGIRNDTAALAYSYKKQIEIKSQLLELRKLSTVRVCASQTVSQTQGAR